MPRNLYDRVEVLFAVRDPMMCHRIVDEILAAYLADTEKARILQPDGNYLRAYDLLPGRRPTKPLFNAQEFLISVAEGRKSADEIPGKAKPRRAARSRVPAQK